jgi:hypothetical protein
MSTITDTIQTIPALVKKYHRHALWVILGLLFGLDIITTTFCLQLGHSEWNPFMIPFVINPLLHGIIKIIAYCILFVVIERAVLFIQKQRPEKTPYLIRLNFQVLYGVIIFVLLFLIWLYLHVIASNIVHC